MNRTEIYKRLKLFSRQRKNSKTAMKNVYRKIKQEGAAEK